MSTAKLIVTMLCFCVCAHAQTQTVAVYSRGSSDLDNLTKHSLEQELTRLLLSAGLNVSLKNETEMKREQMGRLVVGTFVGSCSVEDLPSDWTGTATLAQSSISDGRIIPYFSVDCPRVIQTLAPTLQHLSVPFRHTLLGRALGRVIAHEIYHILAQTTDHDESGLSKARLSLAELTANRFELSPDTLRKIRASLQTTPSVPVAGLVFPVPASR